MSWWNEAGAVIDSCDCDHYRDDCPTNREYGPRIRRQRDTTGHRAETAIVATPEHPRGWAVATCECGWRDFPTNYYEHLERVAPMVEVLS